MKEIKYIITIRDFGDEQCRLNADVELPDGKTKGGFDALVPLLNQIKQTLADDLEARL